MSNEEIPKMGELIQEQNRDRIRLNLDGKGTVTLDQLEEAYRSVVEKYRNSFTEIMYQLNSIIKKLIDQGKITPPITLTARVKSFKSAAVNDLGLEQYTKARDGILEWTETFDEETFFEDDNPKNLGPDAKRKSVDDIFGFTVIAFSQEELKIILENFSKFFKTREAKLSSKKIDKRDESGKMLYRGTHVMIENITNFTASIEIQMRTIEDDRNKRPHDIYKDNKYAKTKEDRQKLFNKFGVVAFRRIIPIIMLIAKDGGKVKTLEQMEALKEIYPDLDITRAPEQYIL